MASTEQEHAELLAEVNRQLQEFGRLLPGTQASLDASSVEGVKSAKAFKIGLDAAGKAAVDVSKAFTDAMGEMYRGEKGMKAYNKSVDAGASAIGNLALAAGSLGVAFGLLSGPIGLLVVGVGAAVKGIAEYTKATNEMSDQLFDSFQKLSRVGGAGADSLQGVYNDMQKLGLGVQDLDKFVALVAGSSKELAMMSGSVIKGRQQYAEMSKGMERFKGSLMNSGMTQDEINEGSIGYLRIQSRIGMTQNKSANELAASTARYLEQQDALTQLTGLTRKEQEATREEIRAQEAFGGKLNVMRSSGDEKQIAAAQELEDTYILLASKSKSAAQGFGDIAVGNLRTEAAQKSMRATQGESMRTAQALAAGQLKAAQGADSIAQAHARTLDTYGESQTATGNYNKVISDFAGDMALKANQTAGGFAKAQKENEENRKRMGTQGGKALSAEQQRQVDLAITQQKSMQNMQDFVRYGVEPATKATAWFAETVETLTSLLPGAGEAKEKLEIERKTKKLEEAQIELVAAQEKRNKALSEAEKTAADESIKAAETKLENSKKERLMYIKNSENFKLTNKEAQELNAKLGDAGKSAEMATTGGGAATGNPNIARQGKRGGATQDTPPAPPPAPPPPAPPPAPPPPAPPRMGRFNRMPGATTTPGMAAPAPTPSGGNAAPPAPASTTAGNIAQSALKGLGKVVSGAIPSAEAGTLTSRQVAASQSLAPGEEVIPSKQKTSLKDMLMGKMSGGGAGGGGGGKEPLSATLPPNPQKMPDSETKPGGGGGGGGIDDEALKKMIIAHEGLVQYPYKDILGKWTIGIGHLIGDGTKLPPEFADWANNGPAYGPGSKNNNTKPAWTMEQVYQQLDSDLQVSKQGASKNTKNFADMVSAGKTAFVDLAFNMGPNWIKQKGFVSLDAALDRKDNQGIKDSLINSKWYTQVGDRGKQVVNLAGAAFAEKGGEFNGPNSGYPATLHGKEAVIPLENNSGNFVKMFEEIASSNREMVAMMEEIVRVNKATNGISEKMLRVAQN